MTDTENKINKYHNSKLFKIIANDTDKIYYGLTIEKELRKVLSNHRAKYKKYIENSNSVDYIPSFEILKSDDAKIILIEKFKCEDADEYNKKLYDFVNNKENPNINNYRPEGYKKQIKKSNKTQTGGEILKITELKPIIKKYILRQF